MVSKTSVCTITKDGKKICTGPPGNNPAVDPPREILLEARSGQSFSLNTPHNSAGHLKDAPIPIKTPQGLAELSNSDVPDDKIFYLETHDLYTKISAAVDLIPDMSNRVKSLDSSDIDKKLAAISKAVFHLKDRVAELYDAADQIVFPPSASETSTTSAEEAM